MSADHDLFRDPSYRDEYEQLADEVGEVYQDAISLRNTFADTTPGFEIRKGGRELTDHLGVLADTARDLIEDIAADTDGVDAEYMRSEGWELSFHDPDELPDDLVFASRVTEGVLYTKGEIDWLFDETAPTGRPDESDITAAADRSAERFPHLAYRFEQGGISVPGVEPKDPADPW